MNETTIIFGFGLGLLSWGVKALISATVKNTQELAILNKSIERLIKDSERIGKLENDVNALHGWRRNKEKDE